MSHSEPNRHVSGLGLQRTVSKDLGSAFSAGVSLGANTSDPQGGGLGLQRTMSKDMGGAGTHPGGLQRTVSRDVGEGAQQGGLQRTMSRDLGGVGPQPCGLQRTMSRDLNTSNKQSGGGLQRTLSTGLGNVQARSVQKDPSRQARKTTGRAERVPRPAGSHDVLPRHNVSSS